jgi:hypothetical protein
VDRVRHDVTQAVAWVPVLGARNCFSHEGNSIKMPEHLGIAVSIRMQAREERDSWNGWSAAELELKAACYYNLGSSVDILCGAGVFAR